jgi:hypothetical protein
MLIDINACESTNGRAGIRSIYVTESRNVLDFTFNAQNQITAILMDQAQPFPIFIKIDFQPGDAFFSQSKSRRGHSTPVSQSISFRNQNITNNVRNAILALNDSGGLIALVVDSNSKIHVAGINHYRKTRQWESSNLKTSQGEASTGEDVAADRNEFAERFSGKTNFYAPLFIGQITDIPITFDKCKDITQADIFEQNFVVDADDNYSLTHILIEPEPAGNIVSLKTTQPTGTLEIRTGVVDGLATWSQIDTMTYVHGDPSTYTPDTPPHYLESGIYRFKAAVTVIIDESIECTINYEQIWARKRGIGFDAIMIDLKVYTP